MKLSFGIHDLKWGRHTGNACLINDAFALAKQDRRHPKQTVEIMITSCFSAILNSSLMGGSKPMIAQILQRRRASRFAASAAAFAWLFITLASIPPAYASDIISARIPPDFRIGSSFTVPFRVREHRIYYIDLDFVTERPEDRDRMKALVGTAFTGCVEENSCGIVTQIKIEIQDPKGSVLPISMKTLFGPHGHYSFTLDGTYIRNLGTLPLKPGAYRLVATAADVDERIHSQRVELTVRFNARANPLGR
jgi:hypothetical protein